LRVLDNEAPAYSTLIRPF